MLGFRDPAVGRVAFHSPPGLDSFGWQYALALRPVLVPRERTGSGADCDLRVLMTETQEQLIHIPVPEDDLPRQRADEAVRVNLPVSSAQLARDVPLRWQLGMELTGGLPRSRSIQSCSP